MRSRTQSYPRMGRISGIITDPPWKYLSLFSVDASGACSFRLGNRHQGTVASTEGLLAVMGEIVGIS